MAIATLTIDINARLASIERDMGRAAQIAQANAKKMQAAFAGVTAAVGALGGVLSVGMFAAWIKQAADTADRLDEMSERTGVAVETLNGLSYAVQLSGGDMDSLEKGLQSVNKRLSEFAAGDKSTVELFKSLGITATDAEGAILQLADAFPQLNKQDQVRVGTELLGKAYQSLVPLLAQGRAGLQGLIEEGQRLNPITAESAKQAAEFNDNMDRLKRSADGLAIQIGNAVIPALNRLAEEFLASRKAGLSFWEAMRGTLVDGLSDSTTSPIKKIREYGKELKSVEEQIASRTGASFGGESMTADLKKRAEVLQNYIKYHQELMKVGDPAAALGINAIGAGSIKPPPLGGAPKTGGARSSPRATAITPAFTDPLADEARAYAEAVEAINRAQMSASTSALDLTTTQQRLLDLFASPEFLTMPDVWKESIVSQAESAIQAEKSAEALVEYNRQQERLNELLGNSQLEAQRADMMLLADAFERGAINAEEFSKAASNALGNIAAPVKEQADILAEFGQEAARGIQGAMADFLFDPFQDGLDGMLKGFGVMIQRMIAEAAAAQLAQQLFGSMAQGGSGGGLLGLAFSAASMFFGGGGTQSPAPVIERSFNSYDGGGFTGSGSRAGGLDGKGGFMALLHPQETVIDHTKGQGMGKPINITVNVAPGTPDEVRRAAGAGAREALRAINGAGRYA